MAASDDSPVTAGQFNKFVETLVNALNETLECMYRRFDSIDGRLAALDERVGRLDALYKKVDLLEESTSGMEAKMASVSQNTDLIPKIFHTSMAKT